MTITVTYFGQLKTVIGHGSEKFEVDSSTSTGDLVRKVASTYRDSSRLLLDEAGRVQGSLLVIVNDEQAPPGEDVRLHNGDRVTFMLPISGGNA